MTEEKAKEYLKETLEEIEENHKNGELILVQKPTTKELKEAIEVVLKELTVKNNKIDKAIKYIKEKQKIQYKYTLSKIEIDELLKILEVQE